MLLLRSALTRLCSLHSLLCKIQLSERITSDHPGIHQCSAKGMDYVHAHTPAEIAQVIKPQFDDTDMETLTAIVKRYQEQDTWKDSLIFEKDSFLLLSDILESAGELSEKVPYEQLVTTDFAKKAASH